MPRMQSENVRSVRATRAFKEVYFAFPDGIFTFDCAACGAKCCRGFGYGSTRGERLYQLKRSPQLRFFVSSHRPDVVQNLPPECFFLNEDLLCRLHVEDGYSAKPRTCRLFPFNQQRIVGDTLVVTPHPGLCPLDVLPAGALSPSSSHSLLFEEAWQAEEEASAPRAESRFGEVKAAIAIERRIRDAANRYRGRDFLEYAAFQLDESQSSRVGSLARFEDASERVARTNELVWLLLEESDSDDDARRATDDLMVALASTLRANVVFPVSTDAHRQCLDVCDAEVIVDLLVALRCLCIVARRAGMRRFTFQSTLRLLADGHKLLILLMLLRHQVEWIPGVEIDMTPALPSAQRREMLVVMRALSPAVQRRSPVSFGDVLLSRTLGHGADRTRFLQSLADNLHGRVRRIGSSTSPSRFGMRARLQQAALCALAPEKLDSLLAYAGRWGHATASR